MAIGMEKQLFVLRQLFRMMRVDHWPKNVLIVPGCLFALSLTGSRDILDFNRVSLVTLAVGTLAICLASSANYLINEYLDRESDRYHPTKKMRSAVTGDVGATQVTVFYLLIVTTVLFLVAPIGKELVLILLIYLILAVLYNCKPIRVKDRLYIDVITESANNPIRLIFGWALVTTSYFPPLTLTLSFWALGVFLMSSKRYAEIHQLQKTMTSDDIAKYRKSLARYSITSLSILSNFSGLFAVLLLGIFSCKYRPEYLLFTVVVLAWITFYMSESHVEDSMVQAPEKLIRSRANLVFSFLIAASYLFTQFSEIRFLQEIVQGTSLKPGDFWSVIIPQGTE